MPLAVPLEVLSVLAAENNVPGKKYLKSGRRVSRLAHTIAVQSSTPNQIARLALSSVGGGGQLYAPKPGRVSHTAQVRTRDVVNLGCPKYADYGCAVDYPYQPHFVSSNDKGRTAHKVPRRNTTVN